MRSLHWPLNAFVLTLAAQLVAACVLHADTADEAKATAALALAHAKRDRDSVKAHAVVAVELSCHADYAVAAKEATERGKPLAVWVGVKCTDHPSLRKGLDTAVHCHVKEWRKDSTPRIVIQGSDGIEYSVREEKLDKPSMPTTIKAKWELPFIPPIRGDAKISEELSRGPGRVQNVYDGTTWWTISPAGTWTVCEECNRAARGEYVGASVLPTPQHLFQPGYTWAVQSRPFVGAACVSSG